VLFIILFVGGLSLLAHWGRENRVAETILITVLLFLSLLVVALGVLVALVGQVAIYTSDLPPEFPEGSAVVIVLAGLAGIALCIPPLRKVTGWVAADRSAAALGHEGLAAAARSTGNRRPAGRFSGDWWSDPPVFFALWMFVIVLTSKVIDLLAFALAPDAVGSVLTSAGRLSPTAIVLTQLPFVVIALFGVGLGIRRNFWEALVRLGYGPIALPQLGVVALFVAGSLLLSFISDALFAALQPDLYERVGKISEGLFSPEGLSPVSAILFALLIGVGAGLGEETLFRGAVQPALGITLTSVLWASMHVQYGPSLLLGYIFVLSVGLGLLRKHINTTASFLAHAGYNSLLMFLAYFLSV
jgi:membrane protease YdiL (CAAX protease family)